MKSFSLNTFLLVIFTSYLGYGYCGELRFFIDDNTSNNYKIVAVRISLNDPLFGYNFMMIDQYNTTYNNVTSDVINTGVQPPFDFYLAYDYVAGIGSYCWPFIGEGKYEISIYREDVLVHRFRIDLVHYNSSVALWSPDIDFQYTYSTGILKAIDAITEIVEIDEYIYSWLIHGETQDLTKYRNQILITNQGNGITNNNINTKLEQAQWGFPYYNYPIGTEFNTGNIIDFWRGAEYGLSIVQTSYTRNDILFSFRHWDNYNVYANPAILKINSSTDEIKSLFYPTQPLTVTNNLEGGNGGTYTVTWDKQSTQPHTFSSGSVYNAFEYEANLGDVYTIQTNSSGAFGREWFFLNWENGSTLNSRTEAITATNKNFTANYKGKLTSTQSDGFSSNGQRKIVRDNNSYYHCVYSSLGKVWYTKSTTTNFDGNWTQDAEIFAGIVSKNPSMDVKDDNFAVVAELQDGSSAAIYLYRNDSSPIFEVALIDNSYYGSSYPVISKTNYELFIVYRKNSYEPLKYRRYFRNNNYPNIWEWSDEADLPYSTSNSKYPSIVGNKINDDVYIVWQEGTSEIKYLYSHRQGNNRTFDSADFQSVSGNCGYSSNTNPSISLSNTGVVVSWTGGRKESVLNKVLGKETSLSYVYRALIRVKASSWGNATVLGSGVNFTNNNSSTSPTGETVIAFSQSSGQTSKWIKRVGAYYSEIGTLSHNGLQVNVSNGSGLVNQKALVFNTSSLPYPINRSTTSFTSLSKIVSDTSVTYGRTGIVGKQGVEFLFCAEDILLDDENIKFTERVDTLPVLNLNELNSAARTNTFNLNGNSNLYFSLYYLVIYPELASSILSDEDYVNFKLELVNANNNLVVGTFDDITFTKQNVYDHENISYKIDCAGIEEGSYYLRIAADANSSTGFSITNNQNDAGELGKRQYVEIYYTGNTTPTEYALAQNFPNPFNPSTTIRYQIPQDGIVNLKIYDILGAEVTTLVNEEKVAGKYEVNFNASSLASGVYIYKIQSGSFINSKKMILLK